MSTQSPATSGSFNAQCLIDFFHSFPHYDISLNPVSSKFNPESDSYFQAILILGAVPVLWMLLWIVIYLVYFCYFCISCRKGRVEKQRKSSRPGKWASFCFAVLGILMMTLSIYGNEMMADSVSSAGRNVKQINQDFVNISTSAMNIGLRAHALANTINTQAIEQASRQTNPGANPMHITNAWAILTNTSDLISVRISTVFSDIVLRPAPPYQALLQKYSAYELYRRLATHGICAFVMICLSLTLCSVGTKRKGFILTCMAFVMVSIMVIWTSAGFYNGISVATADYCTNPNQTPIPTLDDPADNGVGDILSYYTECTATVNPFIPVIHIIQRQVMTAENLLDEAGNAGSITGEQAMSYIADVRQLLHQIVSLGASLDCTAVHRSYVSALDDVCNSTILAETITLCGFLLSGLFLLFLVFTLHCASRHVGNKRAYIEVDANDEFMSREGNNRSDNPLYYRFSQISAGEAVVSQANISASAPPQRSSPPPAYQHTNDFWSTYGNNSSLEANNVPENDLNRDSTSFRHDN